MFSGRSYTNTFNDSFNDSFIAVYELMVHVAAIAVRAEGHIIMFYSAILIL